MGLIDPADGKGADNTLVAALHGPGILSVEGASLLVDHDAVLPQGVVAAPVELPGKQPLRGPEGVGGVHNNEVIRRFLPAYELQRVPKVDMNPPVVHPAGVAGQVCPAGLYHKGIHLHQVDVLHPVIPGQLPHHAAVPCADDQDVPDAGMHRHRHMGHHFIVNKFIPLRQHHIAVQRQHPAEFRRFKDVDALVVALLGIQVPVDPDAVLHIWGMKFAEPHFHILPPFTPARSAAPDPDPPGRSCCIPFLWRTGCAPGFPP